MPESTALINTGKMTDRCSRICGDAGECFTINNKQVQCIADMVVNKISGIKLVIDELLSTADLGNEMSDKIAAALKNVNELTNWVKFLQMVNDLRLLNSLSYESAAERRKEIRYPLPATYRQAVGLKIKIGPSWIPAVLMNFSQHGLQFRCPERVQSDSVHECVLFTLRGIAKTFTFKTKIKHCREEEREFVIGAVLDEITNAGQFNFFENVHTIIAGLE